MKSTLTVLVRTTVAAFFLLGNVTGARAVPVTPTLEGWNAFALSFAFTPESDIVPGFGFHSTGDPLPILASASSPVFTGAPETAFSAAEVAIDPLNFNLSTVKSTSSVGTENVPTSNAGFEILGLGYGALSAQLSTAGLAPGGAASVDLKLNVTGKLLYFDPTGTAGVIDCGCGDLIPDMGAVVSVLFALADVTDIDPLDPDLPASAILFNGSASLQSDGDGAPSLVRDGDWAGSARDGDFTFVGCDAFLCEIDVNLSLTFTNVQALGFGDTFEVGLLMLTVADILSEPGRNAAADFFNTAGLEVTLTEIPTGAPAPGPLFLLAAGLLALVTARRTRRRH